MAPRQIELWGGFECTVVRLHERYRDQTVETGHAVRASDLLRAASLGVSRLRYPVIWERTETTEGAYDWRWADERLDMLRSLGVGVIAGLTHHGGGTPATSLLDPAYPERLARYAAAVAERYPWLDAYTPVNEPLTTARFACLYGHWHPFRTSLHEFALAVFHQCRGTMLAMRAIRRVNPAAILIQTEDIGRIFASPRLAYQAAHENERRWLSLDLLFGRVTPAHPFWPVLLEAGAPERNLIEMAEARHTPDIIGMNHYLTSDRYLDAQTRRHPPECVGGNGVHRYADIAAVRRERHDPRYGARARLNEVWRRYKAPIAITEAHNGCTRDEQMRWVHELWRAAQHARQDGIDVRAVTLWALAGSVDWSSLMLREAGDYEVGALDARCEPPRETALANMARSLARRGDYDHPVLDGAGWWRRTAAGDGQGPAARASARRRRALLVTDCQSSLGRAIVAACRQRDLAYVTPEEANGVRLWAVIDTRHANECATSPALDDLPLLHFSPPQVFDARRTWRYLEQDEPNPVCAAGVAAAEAEEAARRRDTRTLVIRTGPLFGPHATSHEAGMLLAALRSTRVPALTFLPDLANTALDLLIDEAHGVWHLLNRGLPAEVLGDIPAVRTPFHPERVAILGASRGVWLPPVADRLRTWVNNAVEICAGPAFEENFVK